MKPVRLTVAPVTVAFHDGAAVFEGEIRNLLPHEQWEQYVQIVRARRIKRERDTRVVQMRRERDRALAHIGRHF